MNTFTKNTASQLQIDSGARVDAVSRWKIYKKDMVRFSLYHQKFPNIDHEDLECFLVQNLEKIYVRIFAEWEKTTITDEQYTLLQTYLPPEYFVNALATYLCIRYYNLSETIQELKENKLKVTEADARYYNNYLRLIYYPVVIDFTGKCKELRPVTAIFDEISSILATKKINPVKNEGKITFEDLNKISDLISEAYAGMEMFLSWLSSPKYTNIELSDIFEDYAKELESKKLANITPPIIKAQALYPENLAINITKPAHFLSEIEEFNDTHYYRVSKRNAKVQQLVGVTLFAEEEENVEFSRPISIYDRSIIDAVETLAECNKHITASEVYRMMNGGENIKVTPEMIEEIESRIDYMCRIMVKVDYSEHIQMNSKRSLTDKEKIQYIRKGHLLNLDEDTIVLNGKKVIAYTHNAVNPLTKYAKDVGQIATVPAAMLNTKDGQRGGKRAQSIKHYLLQRIYTISGQGDTISLDSLLEAIGEESASVDQLKRIRKTIENFLDLWSYGKIKTSKDKPNKEILATTPIKGYDVKTVGKKITGYILIPKVVEAAKKK